MTLEPLKTHRYICAPNRFAFHSKETVKRGEYVTFLGDTFKVREVSREQQSHYFKKHIYYEIKI